MQAIDLEKQFHEVQQLHAIGIVRDAMMESKTLEEMAAVFRSDKIFPLIRNVKLSDVLSAKSFAKLTQGQVRRKAINVPDWKRTDIKKIILKALSSRELDTQDLTMSVRAKHKNLPTGFTYTMLRELEVSGMVHRVANGTPIIWGVGAK